MEGASLVRYIIYKTKVARLAGFEPAAYGLEVRCSIQLSYRRFGVPWIRQLPGSAINIGWWESL